MTFKKIIKSDFTSLKSKEEYDFAIQYCTYMSELYNKSVSDKVLFPGKLIKFLGDGKNYIMAVVYLALCMTTAIFMHPQNMYLERCLRLDLVAMAAAAAGLLYTVYKLLEIKSSIAALRKSDDYISVACELYTEEDKKWKAKQ